MADGDKVIVLSDSDVDSDEGAVDVDGFWDEVLTCIHRCVYANMNIVM